MQTSLTGRTNGREGLHLHEGHFYAPSQPADQFAPGGWSVGSAGALLGRRARSSSGREASPSSELAVLKQPAPAPFSANAQLATGTLSSSAQVVPSADAAAHVTQAGRETQRIFADHHAQDVQEHYRGMSPPASFAAHSSRHTSSTSSRPGPGSLHGPAGSYSGHSSAPVSPLHAAGWAVSSRQSGEAPGLSRLQSSSMLQSRHDAPEFLGASAGDHESSMSQPGSAGGLHSQHRGASSAMYSDREMQASEQHPLQDHWGLEHASEMDQHNFALERSYSPSSSSRSAVSAHEEDNIPFAGEDSHVLSEWGQGPDSSFYNHRGDLLPQHSGQFGQPLHSLQPQQQQQQRASQSEGEMGSRRASQSLRGSAQEAGSSNLSGGGGEHAEAPPLGPLAWAGRGALGAVRPLPTGPPDDYLGQLDSGLADSRAAGPHRQLPDLSDSGGWFGSEHSDAE